VSWRATRQNSLVGFDVFLVRERRSENRKAGSSRAVEYHDSYTVQLSLRNNYISTALPSRLQA
jgi:hypothetical protein